MSDDQVTDVSGVSDCDLGVDSVNLNAVFNVGDQLLTPADNHRSPVDCHIFDQDCDQTFLINQNADGVLGFRVGCLQVHGLEVTPVINVLLKLLSLDLELCLPESIQTLLAWFALLLLFLQKYVDSQLED